MEINNRAVYKGPIDHCQKKRGMVRDSFLPSERELLLQVKAKILAVEVSRQFAWNGVKKEFWSEETFGK